MQPIDFKEVDKLVDEYENDKLKVKELTEFNEVTPEAIVNAHNFLKKQIEIINAKPSDINSVIFTSGTSGRPKAVIDSHTNVISGGACLGR